jgi:hypothetical protein
MRSIRLTAREEVAAGYTEKRTWARTWVELLSLKLGGVGDFGRSDHLLATVDAASKPSPISHAARLKTVATIADS